MQDRTMKLLAGRTLGFSDYGNPNAVPIMLFHGTPGSRVLGLEADPLLEQFCVRIIAPERPGYGLSDTSQGRKILDWADDVRELADHLGIDKFHVAGESGGGSYALACAIQMPTRVLSATLIGSTCPPEVLQATNGMTLGNKLGFFVAKYMPFLLKWVSASFENAIKKYPDKVLRKMISQVSEWDKQVIGKKGEHKRKILLLHFTEAFRQGSRGHYEDAVRVARSWGYDLGDIKVPVFMWHGEADNLMPIAPAREFSRLIPGCECHFIPEAGHFLLESEDVGSRILERVLSVNI